MSSSRCVAGVFRRRVELRRCVQEKAKTLLALGHRQLKQLNSTSMLVGPEGDKWRGGRKQG